MCQHEGPSRALCAGCSTSSIAVVVQRCAVPAEQSTLTCVECHANRDGLVLIPQLGYLKPGNVWILNILLFCVSKSFLGTVGHS